MSARVVLLGLSLAFTTWLSLAPAEAMTWNVPADAPTVQAGIDSAAAGDTVLVAPGTYMEPPQAASWGPAMLVMKPGVTLKSSGGPSVTTLDAQAQARVIYFTGSGARIEGFTLTNGAALGSGIGTTGAAALFVTAGVTIVDCTVAGNMGPSSVLACWGANATIVGCSIRDNQGGGIYAFHTSGITLSVMTSLVVDNAGDGVAMSGDGVMLVVNGSTLSGNTGHGISIGGIATATITNSILSYSTSGSGILCSILSGGATVSCCDVWGNAGGDGICTTDAGGNFSLDPLFCDRAAGDYTLADGSPCLPGNHPQGENCGLIGALGQGCSGPTATEDATWGAIKGMFR